MLFVHGCTQNIVVLRAEVCDLGHNCCLICLHFFTVGSEDASAILPTMQSAATVTETSRAK